MLKQRLENVVVEDSYKFYTDILVKDDNTELRTLP